MTTTTLPVPNDAPNRPTSPRYRKPARKGIDWVRQYDEVVSLIVRCPAYIEARRDGEPDDDLMQDILRGLLARQRGRSAYDPRRSSLSTYVWLVTRSVVANLRDAQARRWWEVLGVPEADGTRIVDAALHAAQLEEQSLEDEAAMINEVLDQVVDRELVALLLLGHTVHSARRTLQLARGEATDARVSAALVELRAALQARLEGRARVEGEGSCGLGEDPAGHAPRPNSPPPRGQDF